MYDTVIDPGFTAAAPLAHFPAAVFPSMRPIHWLHSHFAVGGWSPLRRLSGMLTAHMTAIAPRNGFTWHPHRGLEIYTWILEGTLHHEDSTGGQGDIGPGELQRMFSGEWIEHQELNLTDEPVRVIQIWYVADLKHRGLAPHYQQLGRASLPAERVGDAQVHQLIGGGSPMEQHMNGRLTATFLEPGGTTTLQAPRPDEDLFVYVTDGAGRVGWDGQAVALGQYDVLLGRPEMGQESAAITAHGDRPLAFLNFYLPRFLG